MLAQILNDKNLPYPDPIHPIIVHFVIAMVFFSFFCDVVGYLSRNPRLLEVSCWNLFVAGIAIFFAVFFGQLEAGLAQPSSEAQAVLGLHTIIGWSLSAFVAGITAWRFILRYRNPLKVPPVYLAVSTFLVCLVSWQMYLGTHLVWVYGLHMESAIEAMKHRSLP